MQAKITLTLEQDEQRGTNAAMEETVKMLAELDALPTMKVVLTLECEEMIAENYRSKLRLGLKRRPIGIIAKIKTTSEEQIYMQVMPPTTPMDDLLGDGIDSVTLSTHNRSVTITAEAARNASAMLHGETTGPIRIGPDEIGYIEQAGKELRRMGGAGNENLFDEEED